MADHVHLAYTARAQSVAQRMEMLIQAVFRIFGLRRIAEAQQVHQQQAAMPSQGAERRCPRGGRADHSGDEQHAGRLGFAEVFAMQQRHFASWRRRPRIKR